MSETSKALAELTPDRMVRQLAEVVRLGCRAFAEQLGREVPQELADLQVHLHVRAAAVQQVVEQRRAAGSGLVPAALAKTPEPQAPSTHDEPQWLSTGEAHRRTGLSTSYLRRLARGDRGRPPHPGARAADGGYEWDATRLPGGGWSA